MGLDRLKKNRAETLLKQYRLRFVSRFAEDFPASVPVHGRSTA